MKNGKVKSEKGEKYQEKQENCDAYPYPCPPQKSIFLVLFISWQKKKCRLKESKRMITFSQ